jgi:hypothetical protein
MLMYRNLFCSSDSAAMQDRIAEISSALLSLHQGQKKIDKSVGTLVDKEQCKRMGPPVIRDCY